MSYAILVIAPPGQPSRPIGTKGALLRCSLVNGAQLKSDTWCAACGEQIDDSYVRQIGAGKIFCDFGCYQSFSDRENRARGASRALQQ